ncbi:MAG: PAS domain S-box protein [Candidatus Zixiibacteriota bacterium]|nr:MAG: PAS domain S-box protein [candidate division Zixibacteria bacterium]
MTVKKFVFDRPVRTKISGTIVTVLLGISLFNLLFFPAQQKELALERMRAKGESTVRMLAYNLSPALDFGDRRLIEEMVAGAFQDEELALVKIWCSQYNDTLYFRQPEASHCGHEFSFGPTDTTVKVLMDGDCLCVASLIKAGERGLGTLTLSFSLKRLEQAIAHRRRLIFAASFLLLLLGIGVTSYLSGFLTNPIYNLTEAALRLTEGQYGTQVSVEHSDEIGLLANAFNRMSRNLKESKEKLEEYSRTLEQRVEERTSELRGANRELAEHESTITTMLEDLNSANRDLARTKNQLESIFKSVVDRAIITIDTEGKISFYSKSSELIFGYEASEVVGKKRVQEFFAQDDDLVFILLEHTREAGIYKGEAELTRRSRQIFPAIVTITPLKGEKGRLTGYTIIVEDITEKKKTEKNIHLLSLAVGSATDGVAVTDLDGRIIFVNRALAKMHGAGSYEMTGKFFKNHFPESYWPVVDQAMQQILVDGSWTGELLLHKKDGDTFPAQVSASLIKDQGDRPMGVLGICQDISEKKKLEQEILRSNRELSGLNTIASTVSQTLNWQEIVDRSLKTIMDLTRSRAGWVYLLDHERKTRMKLVAHHGLSARFAEGEPEFALENCSCWETVRSKQPRVLDITSCSESNDCAIPDEKLQCHLSVPLKSKDQVLGVMNLAWEDQKDFSESELKFFSSVGNEIGIAVDNALLFEDVEQAKEKLQKLNRKLEEASQIKSDFLANTSHELRTPLNSIIGFLGLILDGYCVDKLEEREFLRNAQQSAKQLLSIINDVLDLAKIEAGRMELELQEVELKSLFEEVQSLTQVQAQQKRLELSFACESHPSARVYADPGKLRQVMINLVGNAIKFTDEGVITVRSLVREERGNVLIEVEDTGIGVPAHAQRRLFEKFRQADESSTRKHGGTGLGLTITKNLVEIMGGKIKLESPGEGKGTKISFTVPLYREGKNGEPLHGGERLGQIRGEGDGPLALVVEDDPMFGEFLEDLLEAEGFRTVLAGNADDAVSLAKDLHPQIVVLDYSLPQKMGGQLKDGRQVAHTLLKDPATRDADVIMITGQDLDTVEAELSTHEFDRAPVILPKPVDQKVLLQKIKSVSRMKEKEVLTCEVD